MEVKIDILGLYYNVTDDTFVNINAAYYNGINDIIRVEGTSSNVSRLQWFGDIYTFKKVFKKVDIDFSKLLFNNFGKDVMKVTMNSIYGKPKTNLPKKVIFNDNKTTLLYKSDDPKKKYESTTVKCKKGDKYDKEKGFLLAFYIKHCGLSKSEALKYLYSKTK